MTTVWADLDPTACTTHECHAHGRTDDHHNVPVYQLDGFYDPEHPGDPVIDPDGDGYGVIGGGDDAEHWHCGKNRLVRLHIRRDADRAAAAALVRQMADWLEGDYPWEREPLDREQWLEDVIEERDELEREAREQSADGLPF